MIKNFDKPLAAWKSKERHNGEILDCLTIIFRTGGCRHNRCRMCGYRFERYAAGMGRGELAALLRRQLASVLQQFPPEGYSMVKIFTSGSFLDGDEVPREARDAIAEAFRRIARLQATRAFESGQFERNARGMVAYMKAAEETLGMEVEVEEGATPERAVFRWKKCPLYDHPARESTPELCQAYAAFEIEAARICHPSLRCMVVQSLSCGDDCCEMVFEMEH